MVVPGARTAVESLYSDICTIKVRQTVQPEQGSTTSAAKSAIKRTGLVVLVSGQPCRLSYKKLLTSSGDPAAVVSQEVRLFMSPDVIVPAGSEITVMRQGRTLEFNSSGLPAVYTTHQEIPLEPKERYA